MHPWAGRIKNEFFEKPGKNWQEKYRAPTQMF